MNQKFTLLTSALVSTVLISAIALTGNHQKNNFSKQQKIKSQSNSGAFEDDANERIAWETKRLRDPETGKIPNDIRKQELAYAETLPTEAELIDNNRTHTPSSWAARGPWNVGGRTRAYAVDVANENVLLAGSCSGGMWRSADGGTSWTMTTPLSIQQSVSCLAQDVRSGHTNTWYYGSGEAYGASASAGGNAYYLGNGLYKSTDDGQTWTSLTATAANTPQSFTNFWDLVWNVATNPADTINNDVYAATLGAVYKSTNGGTSWTTSLGGSTSAYSYFTDVQVTTKGVVYATLSSDGPKKGIWRSPDGVTFTNILPDSGFPTTYNRMVIGINHQNENEIYILANTPGFGTPDTNFLGDIEWNSLWKYTYISGTGDSAGGIWTNLSVNLPNNGGLFDKYNCQGSYDMVVKVKPNDSNVVYIGGTDLYRSTSAFADTTHTTFIGGYGHGSTLPYVPMYANHHPDQHVIFFLPSNPNVMFSGNDGGVFKTLNDTAANVTWTSLNNGYTNTMFYTVAVDHASPGNNIVIGGAQDNGSWYTNSTNVTTPWVTPRGGDGSFCAIADNQSAYYFSIQDGKMMRATLDANGNVTNFARIDPIGGKNYLFVNPFVLDPNNNNIMYLAGGKNLWRNNNLSGIPYASNWDSISTNWTEFPDSVPTPNSYITAVAVSKTPANRVYYGTDEAKLYRIDNANTGTPTETNITGTVYPNAFPNGGYINCIAVDPNNTDNVMVVFSNYSVYSIYYSSNGGSTWLKSAGNLEQTASGSGNGPSCRWASIMHVSDGTVYLVATSTGLYATDSLQGVSTVFVQQAPNLIGNAVCDMIDVRPSDGLVVLATHSHGIFSTNITSVNNVASVPTIAANNPFALSNYPNPFTSSTKITFQLNENAMVNITIFDALGREIKTLQDGELSAGKQEFTLQKNNFSNGLYYCVLTVNGQKQVRKMIVTN